jgi:hypothetical protein
LSFATTDATSGVAADVPYAALTFPANVMQYGFLLPASAATSGKPAPVRL